MRLFIGSLPVATLAMANTAQPVYSTPIPSRRRRRYRGSRSARSADLQTRYAPQPRNAESASTPTMIVAITPGLGAAEVVVTRLKAGLSSKAQSPCNFTPGSWVTRLILRAGSVTSAAKAVAENKQMTAALKRCATQTQVRHQVIRKLLDGYRHALYDLAEDLFGLLGFFQGGSVERTNYHAVGEDGDD